MGFNLKMNGKKLITLCLIMGASYGSMAASLRVSPVKLNFSANRNVGELQLSNIGDNATAVQVTAYKWDQDAGEDRLLETKDILFAPPIFVIQAQQAQKLRFIMKSAPDARFEKSYRIILKEIPTPPEYGQTESRAALNVKMRVSLPAFVAAEKTTPSRFVMSVTMPQPGHLAAQISNTGYNHVRITSVDLYPGDVDLSEAMATGRINKDPMVSSSLSTNKTAYALPGITHIWKLELPENLTAGSYYVVAKTENYQTFETRSNRFAQLWQKITIGADSNLISAEIIDDTTP